MLAVYLHTLDPYAIKLWEDGPIRWYGLSYLVGFLLAYLVIRRVVSTGVSSLKRTEVADLVVTLALGIVIGGRLGYVLFYQQHLLIGFTSTFPFWDVLAINKGGMASHGGMIGGILACVLYARRHRHCLPHILDLFAFGAPLGLFLGRIANFVNGELYGRPCSPDLPWAVKFPQEILDWSSDQLAALDPVLDKLPPLSHASIWSAYDQIIHEIQRHNNTVIAAVEPLLTPRHPSQIYEALLEGLLVFIVLAIAWIRPRPPGIVGALFCITYGTVRIVAEFFRTPDQHIANQEFALLHITRGQWLSVLLLIAGCVLLIYFTRRRGELMGGWRKAT